jgi:isoleucyl-tRNA synthetase
MAPILSFTAEEAWQQVGTGDSVMLGEWHKVPEVPDEAELTARWKLVREARAEVQRELEGLRSAGKIGSSLQAVVEVAASASCLAPLAALGNDLRFALITSKATLRKATAAADETITVAPSSDPKCERCWHYVADVGKQAAHPGICGRCVSNLDGPGETRDHA